jgi:hypothetical protein
MKQTDIRFLMAITAGIILVISIQELDNWYFKISLIALAIYLAYKSRFF